MATAKAIRVAPVDPPTAREFIRKNHYSGKVASNSQLHLGVFLGASLEGVMQFGPPLDRNKMLGLVEGSKRENVLELNRMAFTDRLPRNSESRAISVAFRLLRKYRPEVGWVISFADATQCGDGTIYRASGFKLTSIKESRNLARLPSGEVIHKMSLETSPASPRDFLGGRSYYDVTGGHYSWDTFIREIGLEVLPGYQLRYIAFIQPGWEERLTVPVVPFSELRTRGVSMYRGQRLGGVS